MKWATPLHSVTPPVGVERRGEPRTLCDRRAQLLVYPPGAHSRIIEIAIIDFSRSGIGAIHSEGLLVGQLFVVREPTITKGQTCLYSVVRSDLREDGTYSIGLQAINRPGDEWNPFSPPPAPGVDLGSKLLYLIFAIAGAATIVALAIILRHRH